MKIDRICMVLAPWKGVYCGKIIKLSQVPLDVFFNDDT